MSDLGIVNRIDFSEPEDLAEALARVVAENITASLENSDTASLAVSGGSTPVQFFEALSTFDLPWGDVILTLVDERWVGPDDPRSNAGLVARHLLKNKAQRAKFVPLFNGSGSPTDGLADLETRISEIPMPFSAVVLGMGTDGHTASFFPGGDHLAAALDSNNQALLSPMEAAGAGEARVTLTFHALMKAERLYLHIEGQEKLDVLKSALSAGPVDELPVRAVLRQKTVPLTVYWAPK